MISMHTLGNTSLILYYTIHIFYNNNKYKTVLFHEDELWSKKQNKHTFEISMENFHRVNVSYLFYTS